LKSSKKKAGNTNLNSDFIQRKYNNTVYALTKDGYYRKIQSGKIGPAKKYTSDEDIEFMKIPGRCREGAGGNQPAERKKYIMLQMKKMCKSENTCKNSEINNSKVIGRL